MKGFTMSRKHRRKKPRPWLLLARAAGDGPWRVASRWPAAGVACFAGLALRERGEAERLAIRREA